MFFIYLQNYGDILTIDETKFVLAVFKYLYFKNKEIVGQKMYTMGSQTFLKQSCRTVKYDLITL